METSIDLYNLFSEISGHESADELRDKLILERSVLRAIIDNLPSSIYVKDGDGRKIVANKANYTQAGFKSEEDVIGKTDFDMFPKDVAQRFYEDDCTVLKQGQVIKDREEKVVSSDGEEYWQITEKLPFKDEQGNVIGLVGFGHDITAEKNLEKEKINAAQQLENQQNMVENMIVDLSGIPKKIESLVDGIAHISKQTKMVSINAAIEAARVGEHGRGFEIVAREVGELSDQSGKATTEVRKAIDEVNSLVQNIMQLWEEVKKT